MGRRGERVDGCSTVDWSIHGAQCACKHFLAVSLAKSKLITIIVPDSFRLSHQLIVRRLMGPPRALGVNSVHWAITVTSHYRTHTHTHARHKHIALKRTIHFSLPFRLLHRSANDNGKEMREWKKSIKIVILRASIQSYYWVKRTKYIMATSTRSSNNKYHKCRANEPTKGERAWTKGRERESKRKGEGVGKGRGERERAAEKKNSYCNRNLNAYIVESQVDCRFANVRSTYRICYHPPYAVCLDLFGVRFINS